MTFLPILASVTVEPYIPVLSNFVPKPDNTDEQTLGHTCNHLINGRAMITAAICVLAWYLDLQAHPFQGLKRQAVISGVKGQRLDRLSLICEKLYFPAPPPTGFTQPLIQSTKCQNGTWIVNATCKKILHHRSASNYLCCFNAFSTQINILTKRFSSYYH